MSPGGNGDASVLDNKILPFENNVPNELRSPACINCTSAFVGVYAGNSNNVTVWKHYANMKLGHLPPTPGRSMVFSSDGDACFHGDSWRRVRLVVSQRLQALIGHDCHVSRGVTCHVGYCYQA